MGSAYKRSLYSGLVRICANVFMLGSVFLAMFQAVRSPAGSLAVFCLWFFGLSIPAWAAAWFLIRRIHRRYPDSEASFVELPRYGRRLVSWRVLDAPGWKRGSVRLLRGGGETARV